MSVPNRTLDSLTVSFHLLSKNTVYPVGKYADLTEQARVTVTRLRQFYERGGPQKFCRRCYHNWDQSLPPRMDDPKEKPRDRCSPGLLGTLVNLVTSAVSVKLPSVVK